MSDSGQTSVLYIDATPERQDWFQSLFRSVFDDTVTLLAAESDDILSRLTGQTPPDCIIAAVDDAPEAAAKRLVRSDGGARIPFIALIDEPDEGAGLRAMHGGADDFLMREGLSEAQLRRSIISAVRLRALRAELHALQATGDGDGLQDPLTGMASRRLFHDRMAHSMVLAARARQSIALMTVKLCHLRDINIMHGHELGDAVLVEAASRIRRVLRQADSVARISGRKFGVLLETGATYEGMNIAARKINEAMDVPFETDQGPIDLNVDIGIALFPDHGEDVDTLMHNAESAMLEASRRGGGFVVFAYDDMLSGFYETPQAG